MIRMRYFCVGRCLSSSNILVSTEKGLSELVAFLLLFDSQRLGYEGKNPRCQRVLNNAAIVAY